MLSGLVHDCFHISPKYLIRSFPLQKICHPLECGRMEAYKCLLWSLQDLRCLNWTREAINHGWFRQTSSRFAIVLILFLSGTNCVTHFPITVLPTALTPRTICRFQSGLVTNTNRPQNFLESAKVNKWQVGSNFFSENHKVNNASGLNKASKDNF